MPSIFCPMGEAPYIQSAQTLSLLNAIGSYGDTIRRAQTESIGSVEREYSAVADAEKSISQMSFATMRTLLRTVIILKWYGPQM